MVNKCSFLCGDYKILTLHVFFIRNFLLLNKKNECIILRASMTNTFRCCILGNCFGIPDGRMQRKCHYEQMLNRKLSLVNFLTAVVPSLKKKNLQYLKKDVYCSSVKYCLERDGLNITMMPFKYKIGFETLL